MNFVGIDIGKNEHVAARLGKGQNLLQADTIKIDNTTKGRKRLTLWLKEFGRCQIALEQFGGWASPLDWRLTKEHQLYIIHPKRLSYARQMYGQPVKTDTKDAMFLAWLLRQGKEGLLNELTQKSIQKVLPMKPVFRKIKDLSRHLKRVGKEHTRTKNRLSQKVSCYLPELKTVFKVLDGKACLSLLSKAPCPSDWQKIHSHTIASWFKKAANNCVGYKKVKELKGFSQKEEWEKLPSQIEKEIKHLAQLLSLLKKQKQELRENLAKLLNKTPEGKALITLPGCDVNLASVIIGELMPIKRFPSHNQLARYVGMTQVRHQSGKKEDSRSTKVVNKHAKWAFRQLALINRGCFKPSKHYCVRKEKEGKSKYLATLSLGRQLVKVVYSMLKNKQPFDPKRV